jgi:acyl carrier protein
VNQDIQNLVADVLQMPAAAITEDVAMKDLDAWDSLKHMELVVAVEQNFQIQLTFDEILLMQSVGAIENVLRQRGVPV